MMHTRRMKMTENQWRYYKERLLHFRLPIGRYHLLRFLICNYMSKISKNNQNVWQGKSNISQRMERLLQNPTSKNGTSGTFTRIFVCRHRQPPENQNIHLFHMYLTQPLQNQSREKSKYNINSPDSYGVFINDVNPYVGAETCEM